MRKNVEDSDRKHSCAPLDEIPRALAKTGFVLEYDVGEAFRSKNWSTINNRYYVDDVDGKARELDLVAYRVIRAEDIEVVTVVLVSCKKDEQNTWAFLTRERPTQDPNFDWEPVHFWTDFEPLASYLDDEDWKPDFLESSQDIRRRFYNATSDVFAFQLVSRDGKAPKNDAPIFDSMAGLLKALDFEIGALPNRVAGMKRLYLFSLMAVVDAPMVEVRYDKKGAKAKEVNRIVHLARYMVRKRALSAQVHYVRSDTIDSYIDLLHSVAAANAKHAKVLVRRAFKAITSSRPVQSYFAQRLHNRLLFAAERVLAIHGQRETPTRLGLYQSGDELHVELDVSDDAAEILNSDERYRDIVGTALSEVARYDGKFQVASEIPF